MTRACLITAVFTMTALLSITQPAPGQVGTGNNRYQQQRRSPYSPYLNLFRGDSGPLPAYQQFVRPRIQQQQFERQGRQAVQQLQRRLQQFQADTAPPTGAASRFRNSSAYFRNNLQFFQTHRPRR